MSSHDGSSDASTCILRLFNTHTLSIIRKVTDLKVAFDVKLFTKGYVALCAQAQFYDHKIFSLWTLFPYAHHPTYTIFLRHQKYTQTL